MATVYDAMCEHTMKFIIVLRQLGFTLQEIKHLLTLNKSLFQQHVMKKRYSLFSTKIAQIEQRTTILSACAYLRYN